MKQRLFVLFFALIMAGTAMQAQIAINETNFPDENFRNWILAQDYGQDGVLTEKEIRGITSIDVSFKPEFGVWGDLVNEWAKIKSLKGIELFAALTWLHCEGNQLTALNVSQNSTLTVLYCEDNQLTTLNVSQNSALTELNCSGNPLTTLDLSHNTALTSLRCNNNQLTALDVSKCTKLIKLSCMYNQLGAFDVSQNTELTYLNLLSNQLTTLDVSQNTKLTTLDCWGNQLTTLDVSQNTALRELNIYKNPLTTIDISHNVALTKFFSGDSPLTALDVSQNTALTFLDCEGLQLTTLDVSHNIMLNDLRCQNNKLTSLDISKNTALRSLYCGGNQLVSLDATKNTALTELYCNNNQLASLAVSQSTARLARLYCNHNQIKDEEMDKLISSLPTVKSGDFIVIDSNYDEDGNVCYKTQVAAAKEKGWRVIDSNFKEFEGSDAVVEGIEINAENFPDENFRNWILAQDYGQDGILTEEEIADVTSIDVKRKSITDLKGIKFFTALTELDCRGNQLTTLDVSNNTKLNNLNCSSNQLTMLDVSNNTKLDKFDCRSNQLTTLDIPQNPKLVYLNCSGNQLTTLDVSNNKDTLMISLDCSNNQLTSLNVSNSNIFNIYCNRNQLKGAEMDKFISSLRDIPAEGYVESNLYIIEESRWEGNVCTKAQVAAAKAKRWIVYDKQGNEYEGSDPVVEGIEINAENFPDENFRNWILAQDYGQDGVLTEEEIADVTSIDVKRKSITDLKGIKFFTALTELDCRGNQLTTLDVSNNTKLNNLNCSSNQLTMLDVSNNTKLDKFDCRSNQLTTLDIPQNPKLVYLNCSGNQLTTLDVSNNKDTLMISLDCSNNQLTSLNVSNSNIFNIYCNRNQLKGAEMDKFISSLRDIPAEGYVESNLYIIEESRWEGNVCTKAQVAAAKAKRWIVYDKQGNEYEGSDPVVEGIEINAENFPDENFRNWILAQSYGQDGILYENEIADITQIDVSMKGIANLKGVEYFTALTRLDCYMNQLTALDMSQNAALTWLSCYNNQLTSLDVSQNTKLTTLECPFNLLTTLDVSHNTKLTRLDCYMNQLTSLDVSHNTKLTRLDCHSNQLTALDVSQNTALQSLSCGYNQLTSLDVSQNSKLTALECQNNQLTALDVSQNTALRKLRYNNNQLTVLDVSQNTALTMLYCFSNQIKGADMDNLVSSLPTVERGDFYVIDTQDENEGNVCTKAQVAVAKAKGWKVRDGNYPYPEYEGSDPVVQEIDTVDEGDNVDFGSDMDEDADLNGNVIGNIFYNISSADGGYDAEEGCVVVTKPMDDGQVNSLEQDDIFGDTFKNGFTGIVFKVPEGKGKILLTAETTGSMVLKVKIGAGDPIEMELEGKLKVTFPYNVSEETLVYIYGSQTAQAKGNGVTATSDDALKIYNIAFVREGTTGISKTEVDADADHNWYTLDGRKLNGEPTKAGVYIHNGRKIKK